MNSGPVPASIDEEFTTSTNVVFATDKGTFASTGFPQHLRMELVGVEPRCLRARIVIEPIHLNRFGVVHGGVICALADHLTGAVVTPLIAPGTWPATIQLNVHTHASSRVGELLATATVVTLTRRTALVETIVRNEGREVALATGTVLLTTSPTTINAKDAG
jgi:1,4-dihydroxy-2-naphthoyl-CoA hydrolase